MEFCEKCMLDQFDFSMDFLVLDFLILTILTAVVLIMKLAELPQLKSLQNVKMKIRIWFSTFKGGGGGGIDENKG